MQETTTTINLPTRLAEQIETLIQAGWFSDVNTLVIEALRRYLESHRLELMEEYIWRDVERSLRRND